MKYRLDKKKGNKRWFILPEHQKQALSVAEAKIASELKRLNITFLREVSFSGFKTPDGGYYRYDFLIPKYNLIIEYENGETHDSEQAKEIDNRIKDTFALSQRFKLYRFNRIHFFNLENCITSLIDSFKGIKPVADKVKNSEIFEKKPVLYLKEKETYYYLNQKSRGYTPDQNTYVKPKKKRPKSSKAAKYDKLKKLGLC